MRYPQIPVPSAIVAVLLLVPLPSQLRTRNVATLTLVLSTILLSVINVVNTLVWNGNTRDVAPRWCDFASTFANTWGYFAIGACLCICKNLEWITSSQSARHHQLLFEVTFCVIIPLISIPFRYILAPVRYVIFEDFGCLPHLYYSVPLITLMWVPQLIFGLLGFIFACLAARNLITHKITSQAHISTSVLTTSRFVRLLLSCAIVGVWPLLVALLSVFFPWWSGPIPSLPGWAAVHHNFQSIPAIPFSSLTADDKRTFLRSFWYEIISGFLIFGMFVFTEDVRNDLRRFWEFLTHRMPHLRRCNALPPSSPLRQTAGDGSWIHMSTKLVVGVSDVKTLSGESSSTCEPMPDTVYNV